jgi:hypothetical protein
VALVLRYHRMYGRKQLYRQSRTGVHLLTREDALKETYFVLGYDLTMVLGNALMHTLGDTAARSWFPAHNFTVDLRGDRGFQVHCESLEAYTGAEGLPYYASNKAPTVLVRGRRRRLGFAPHALDRLGERAAYSRSYASLGDVFGFVENSHYYTSALLHGSQDAVGLFETCAPGFFSSIYAQRILGVLEAQANYVYRVGYAPLADDGDFVVAKTVLPPGYHGTPEYHALRRTSFAPGVQDDLLARSSEQSYAMLCQSRDFTLLRWYHQHGIPQIYRRDQGRLVPA